MSFAKAAKNLKPLVSAAKEYHKLVAAEGHKSDRENARIKELAGEIIANWETVAQYEDRIERFCEHGPRTEAEELMIKGFSKRLKAIGAALWKARGVDDLVVPKRQQKALRSIRGDVKRWKGWVKNAPARTASAESNGAPGGDKTKEKEQQQAMA